MHVQFMSLGLTETIENYNVLYILYTLIFILLWWVSNTHTLQSYQTSLGPELSNSWSCWSKQGHLRPPDLDSDTGPENWNTCMHNAFTPPGHTFFKQSLFTWVANLNEYNWRNSPIAWKILWGARILMILNLFQCGKVTPW